MKEGSGRAPGLNLTAETRETMPRLVLAAEASGTGKTTLTLGLLQALKRRGLVLSSCKCGPDYIDPMYHRMVTGSRCCNLDSFLADPSVIRSLLADSARGRDLCLIEGVMGYYDGLGGRSDRASTYEIAKITDSPTVLVLNAKGASLTLAAVLRGLSDFRKDSRIAGVILNRVSPSFYPVLKELLDQEMEDSRQERQSESQQETADGRQEFQIGSQPESRLDCLGDGPAQGSRLPFRVYGYLPDLPDLDLKSRHLGLVLPEEVPDLERKLDELACKLEETVDIDGLIRLARSAGPICPTRRDKIAGLTGLPGGEGERGQIPLAFGEKAGSRTRPAGSADARADGRLGSERAEPGTGSGRVRIGVARDEAFCFFYQENLDLLEEMGADLTFFSPMRDPHLPEGIRGLLLYGGYPEFYLPDLSANRSMLEEVRAAVSSGLPTLAECGGFLYLLEEMIDLDGRSYPMAGALPGKAYYTGHLTRFGYVTMTEKEREGAGGLGLLSGCGPIRGHEFHYYDTDRPGDAFRAGKPTGGRAWDCMQMTETLAAGFPHLYYPSNPALAGQFLDKCRGYGVYIKTGKSGD